MPLHKQLLRWGGLRGKFSLFIGALLIALTASLTFVNVRTQQSAITERALEKAVSISRLLKIALSEEITSSDSNHLQQHLAPVRSIKEVEYVYAYDRQGRVISDGTIENPYNSIILKDDVSLKAVSARTTLLQYRGDLLDIAEPVLTGDQHGGGVRVGYSLKQVKAELAFVRNVSLGIGTLIALLAGLLAHIVVTRFVGPIEELKKATEAISNERFDAPVQIDTGDELEILGNALNKMARSLKHSRDALIRSKENTDNIITSMLDMLVVTDRRGIIRTVNRSVCMLTGYEPTELIGMHIQRLFPTYPFEDLDATQPYDERTYVGVATEIRTKNGEMIPASFTGSVVFNRSGHREGYVGIGHDMRDHLKTERLFMLQAMQQEAIAKLGQLALSSPSLQHVMDEAVSLLARTLEVSHNSVCELLPEKDAMLLRSGYGWPDGIIGKAWVRADMDTQVGYTLSVNRPVVLENLDTEQRFKGTHLLHDHNLVSGVSVVVQGSDGPWGVLAAHSTELRTFTDEEINFLQAVANVISMTIQRHRQENALVASKNEAEEMSRLKSSFLANMSHEIRTPLTIMIGYAEALTEMVPEQNREFAERIETGGHRLLQTLNSVLELSRLQAREMRLKLEDADVSEEVERGLSMLTDLAKAKNIKLRFVPSERPVFARVDRGSFQRVLDNLVGNAIKFTPAGNVTIRVQEEDARVCVRIRDNGVGISQEFLPHLFDEFKQESTGEARSHEGSGLGLTITRQLVEMHGGRIAVESEKGVGTTFSVWLPRIEVAPKSGRGSPAEDRKPTRNRDAKQSRPRRRALVLDDSLETRELLRFFIGPYFDMTMVGSADEVFASTWEGRFDVVLLDINIGDEEWSGMDVMNVLRKLPEYADTPIIAITAYALPGDKHRFLDAGFDGYVAKPFVKSELLDEISRLVGDLGDPHRDGQRSGTDAAAA